ncbi:MAG: methyltransferase domain-containing protein [Candidatus Omnitrophica bacterium]|nr:methyltransferase domain-containing protein [Candidatus Omnitrophota bacterium]
MINHIKQWFRLPENEKITSLDDPKTTESHSRIIQSKPILKEIYIKNYKTFQKVFSQYPDGKFVELGSGGGFIKDVNPTVITSDVLYLGGIDLCFSGEALPLKNNSVDVFVMIDVLHHIKNPRKLLNEMNRCLKVNGKIIMIEPANTWWGRFIYQNFHHEPFDPTAGWNIEGVGPMSNANGALPWIIFTRDRIQFQKEYPGFQINSIHYHSPLCYLISGGVSMKQLLPSVIYPLIQVFEILISPLNHWLGMFCKIELQKMY